MSEEVLIVTGGASGIGRAVVLLAARRGWKVGILDYNADGLTPVRDEALAAGAAGAVAVRCDVASEDAVAEAFETVERELGPMTGLFTSAGIERPGFAHELALETWQRVIDTNLTGTFLACREALRSLLHSQLKGSLVCCSSPAGLVAFSAGAASAYSASKGGVSALVRSLAVDYASHGIRVNAVLPGPTETPMMWANTEPSQMGAMRELIETEVPLGRLAEPEEQAQAVMWLLSPESSYVTGSHLTCDGGILAKASISF